MSEITSNTGRQSHAKISAVISEVEKVVVGKRHELELLLSAMLSGGHILIEDVPGVGKRPSHPLSHVLPDLISSAHSLLPTSWHPT